jgi:hypothetical protein
MQLTLTESGALYLAHHKISNAAVRFSGICAVRAGSSPLIFDDRLSSPPSSGDFIGTTVAERIRILECARLCDPQAWLNVPLRKM